MGTEEPGRPIFISYRRADRDQFAEPFYQHLAGWFGPNTVFLDRKDIDPGVEFPAYLDEKVSAAKVVLVLITPIWLDELKRRLASNEVDYVRREVTRALALAQDKTGPLIVPVLWEVAAIPKDQLMGELAPLAVLMDRNAVQLEVKLSGKVEKWGVSFVKLRRAITDKTGLHPVPTVPEFQAWAAAHKTISDRLKHPSLAALSTAWGVEPLGSFDPDRRGDLVASLVIALQTAKEVWAGEPPNLETAKQRHKDCLTMLSCLCGLLVDRAAAREWCDEGSADRPMPVALAGTAAIVHAVATDSPVELRTETDDEKGFHSERTIDLVGHAGIGKDRNAKAHKETWTRAKKTVSYPAGASEPLPEDKLDEFRKFLAFSAKVKKPYVLTDVVGDQPEVMQVLQSLAEELGIAAVGRLGKTPSHLPTVLHQDEIEMKVAIMYCLNEINTIGTTP
ncbi:toll/interleukin-1 receptor domain-containing protein [Sphaerotilus sp.]|uniref:toll/interleukin-1 receptor domain-containing protein n=1 Tax=Sphaerotilus sp. TaxID=2093942 RepID=UPI00286D9F33|nr:toll/interleukin-1 receptor domain-containing protein [Sphaerotilus sp.]